MASAQSNAVEPAGEVILSVTSTQSDIRSVDFDMAGVEALPSTSLSTTTPWTEGEQVFDGVLIRDLIGALNARGSSIKAIALNDYVIEIPMSDIDQYDVIIAYRHNGATMSVREKGPLWIIYPDDQAGPMAQSRMVWQLRRIEVQG